MAFPPGIKRASRDEALPHFTLPSCSPPPYYEANAYPKAPGRRPLRRFATLLTVILLGLIWLDFYARRNHDKHDARIPPTVEESFSHISLKQFQTSSEHCAAIRTFPQRVEASSRKTNPRWNDVSGQKDTVVLRNGTLFDGETFLSDSVDIVFEKGLVVSVVKASSDSSRPLVAGAKEYDLHGQYVTPGLVDMHSHHLVSAWPSLGDGDALEDANEVHPDFGPLTPFVRAIDGMKAYDPATKFIAAGGVTSSLVIPGSANIIGGEGAPVKNLLRSGRHGEYVVEDLLLERGVPLEERLRYIKMACGENPKRVYGHTRIGDVWLLRKQFARAKELLEKQDAWCEGATGLSSDVEKKGYIEAMGSFPVELELDSTVGLLRGRVALHNHCYEPEDLETMLRVSREFGFRVRAFHHAISAWLVPEMLKEYGQNLTIATFAEDGLYKREAYQANLYAGKILNEHGVPVAYKSDHFVGDTNSRYLLLQAAVGHSFHLPADKALQAVTSIPAAAIDLDYRIGYVRPGYDADIVVWDAHPLSIGATPRQVFIDGIATLDPVKVEESIPRSAQSSSDDERGAAKPVMRTEVSEEERQEVCTKAKNPGQQFIISGIKKSFLENYPEFTLEEHLEDEDLTLAIDDGTVTCLGYEKGCAQARSALNEDATIIHLKDGHISPGLTAVTSMLGLLEIAAEPATGDGVVIPARNNKDPSSIDYAKYGVTIGGRSIARARLGGVTRAITAPFAFGGAIRGVSTGFRTGNNSNLLNGGLFQPDVALHVNFGEAAKVTEGTGSKAINDLRQLLTSYGANQDGSVYASVAKGSLSLVVQAESQHDIQQVILLKKDFPDLRVVIQGGHAAPLFAKELAEAKIPLILTAHRGSRATWSSKDALPGPPLGRSPASVLSEAGVLYALAIVLEGPPGDSRVHDLALEASWAAKYAGLTEREAIQLVSKNVEEALGLKPSKDIVIWEGNPLQFGTPVLAFQEGLQGQKLELNSCWPKDGDE